VLLQLLFNGAWVDAAEGDTFPITDPRNEQTILNAASAGAVDVDKVSEVATYWQRMMS
jgi:acyl-CoA reductase-like NAD-dependent aldehyde dehydrogenase